MKALLPLFALMLCCTFVRADVATDLAALKAAFPEWAPPSTLSKYNPQDPLVKECAEKYKKTVASITPANLAGNITYLRAQLERDIAKFGEMAAASEKTKSTGAQFYAAKANHLWLTKKVKPYVEKLAALK